MRIAICDDDKQEIERLTALLDEYRANRETDITWSTFKNGFDLLFGIKGNEYDLILLDILMPGINGMQAAKEIREVDKNIKIIFLTFSPEFAMESYLVGAYHYLLKPATGKSLFPLLDRVEAELSVQGELGLLIKEREGVMRLSFSTIEYVEVMNKNVSFHLADGSVRVCFGSLSDFEEELLSRTEFIKIHRSFLVNLRHIQSLNARGATTRTGHVIPISRLIYPQVKASYMQYLFEPDKGISAPTPPPVKRPPKSDAPAPGIYQLLVVDDESEQLSYWAGILREKGCIVHTALTGAEALRLAGEFPCECILLDVMMPGDNGFTLCHKLRKITSAPVVFLSCRTDSESQLTGFQAGGIDYITKDTPANLFWAKIESRIRSTDMPKDNLQFGTLMISLARRRVQVEDRDLNLTSTEFDLLQLLAENTELTFTPKELYQAIWGLELWDGGQTIQVHMSRLRRKLDAAYTRHQYIETVWGQGYHFVPPAIL